MQIEISKSAKKSLQKMDTKTRDGILEGINKIPFGDIKKMQNFENDYRLRIGSYRVLYTVYNNIITKKMYCQGVVHTSDCR